MLPWGSAPLLASWHWVPALAHGQQAAWTQSSGLAPSPKLSAAPHATQHLIGDFPSGLKGFPEDCCSVKHSACFK